MSIRWLNEISEQFLKSDYLLKGQTVDDRINIICDAVEYNTSLNKVAYRGWFRKDPNLKGLKTRIKSYIEKGWCSLSSPIWSNFGTDRGLPISCYGTNMEDSMESIVDADAEMAIMSKYGGGTSAFVGKLRGRGFEIKDNGHSSGSVHFVRKFENTVATVSQGSTRRGSLAVYENIDHPDIMEFLSMRSEGSLVQDVSFGVCISDEWMQSMIDGDGEKRKVWAKVLSSRKNTGYPYLFFSGNANKFKPRVYHEHGLVIDHTNLCTEIMLPNSTLESFVCDLLSANILYYREWRGTNFIFDLIYILDAVMSEFIRKAQNIKYLERAVRFAERHRALGLGWLGYHSYLQSQNIPFESMHAKRENVAIARYIDEETLKATRNLAKEYGEPELLKGYGERNTTRCAIAPTTSSSFILEQVSKSVEPFESNYYIKDLAKGKYSVRNPFLKKRLEQLGIDNDETWDSILKRAGSVQHLDKLTQHDKDVFRTFSEISMMEVIQQAAQRQPYIDQGQSINLMIHPDVSAKDVNALIIEAWRLNLKSLYYQYSINAAQEFTRSLLDCKSCEA